MQTDNGPSSAPGKEASSADQENKAPQATNEAHQAPSYDIKFRLTNSILDQGFSPGLNADTKSILKVCFFEMRIYELWFLTSQQFIFPQRSQLHCHFDDSSSGCDGTYFHFPDSVVQATKQTACRRYSQLAACAPKSVVACDVPRMNVCTLSRS